MKFHRRAALSLLCVAAFPGAPSSGLSQPAPTADTDATSVPIGEDEARIELTRLLRYDKRFTEAISEYRELIRKMPDRTDLRLELAELYGAVGETDNAFKAISGIDESKLDRRGLLIIANLEAQKKNFDKAIGILRGLLAKEPGDPALQLQLAKTLSWAKNYEESLKLYAALVAAAPADVQLRRQYARVLGWASHYDDAIVQWKLTLTPKASAP
ncbi:MAG: tetratricopeptide repeat protein [Terrimicrobiaceae bacterium]|nr:tetratricopeptide repeat protein [Terrimicrobiaceae bacterium]